MQRLLVTAAAFLAIAAVVPAHAQSTQAKNSSGGVTCFYQNDSSRLTGYYGACTEKIVQAPSRRGRQDTPITNVVTVTDSNRDSGGGSGSGGGGGGR